MSIPNLSRAVISLIAILVSACQAPSPSGFQSAPNIAEPTPATNTNPSTKAAQSDQNRYQSEQFGLSFAYPKDFVVDDSQENSTASTQGTLQTMLELWQRQQYQAIQAGKYQGGTELPPNVQILVYSNDNRLPLQEWVKNSNQFVQPGNFQTQSIAGQSALAFDSTGLYEYENIVFLTPDGSEVIVISLAEVGVAEVDEPNRQAFKQVISTFQFIAP